MLELESWLMRLHRGGALLQSMGPGRHSLRVAARVRADTSVPTAGRGLSTPCGFSKISKVKLKQIGSLKLEAGTRREEGRRKSGVKLASEEFRLRALVPKADGIKRKLNFGSNLLTMNDLNRDRAATGSSRARKMIAKAISEVADDVAKEPQAEAGLHRSNFKPKRVAVKIEKAEAESEGDIEILDEFKPKRVAVKIEKAESESEGDVEILDDFNPKRVAVKIEKAESESEGNIEILDNFKPELVAVKIEKAESEEEGDIEILEIVKQEPSKETKRLRRKLANDGFARATSGKMEAEGRERKTESHRSLKREPRQVAAKRESDFKISAPKIEGEKGEERHTEFDDTIKREPRKAAGPRSRKLQRNVFARVTKLQAEEQQTEEAKREFDDIVKQEVPDEVRRRKRKKPERVSAGATPIKQAADEQRGRKASRAFKTPSPGLEVIRVLSASGAQLASESDPAIIMLPGPYPSYARPFPGECQQAKDLLSGLHGHLPEYERHKISCPTSEPHIYVKPLQSLGSSSNEIVTSSQYGVVGKSGLEERDDTGRLQLAVMLAASSERDHGSKNMIHTDRPRKRGTVLDSLVGTLLSQNTTNNNSTKAFSALKSTFPTWEKVLRADPKKVEDAIRCGGLAEIKAQRIRTILGTLLKERGEISMEYIRYMSNEDIKVELSRFKGVGPKTVACVLMFHLQRNEFPVDTHVFRISKMLGWVPEQADREKAYLHLNQRIPDSLKFDIHCLFVTHGRRCPKCAKRINQQPADGACPLLNWTSKWSKISHSPLELDYVG